MDRDICLTPDEVAALREVLAALSVLEERGLDDMNVIHISRGMWRDILLRPAQRLRRVTTLSTASPTATGERDTP